MMRALAWGLLIVCSASAFAEAPLCFRDLERTFFQPNLLNETLALHNISQSNWNLINYELRLRIRMVPLTIRERAKKQVPNPLGERFDPVAAQVLLEEALVEALSSTLALFHITNQTVVREIFEYVRQRQRIRWEHCFGSFPSK